MRTGKLWAAFRPYLWITLASAVFALGFDWCYVPNQITLGGMTGLGQIIHAIVPAIPVGSAVIALNLPLFLLGWRLLGWKLLASSLFATAATSLGVDLLAACYSFPPMDPMLASVFGGALIGLSLGMVFLQGATTGGTDLIARLLAAGYERRDQVDGVCQFSQRGGIIDFYPPHMPDPFRLEFWGDEIDSIAVFKTDTQHREDNCKRCMITPAREVLYDSPESFADDLEARAKKLRGKYSAPAKEHLLSDVGKLRDGLTLQMKEEDFDAVLDTNLKGAFCCCKAVYRPMMRQRSGRIINMSSIVGLRGNAGQANYSASKAGLIGLTKSLAKELAARKVTVNAVAPGFIDTEMTAVLPEQAKEAMLKTIPMARLGQPEDVARAVAFFAGEGAGYVTGQVLCVDGGMAV